MKKFMQKINSFAKRFFEEISETDVLPEYDINNLSLAASESINDNDLEELKKAQKDTMSLYSGSVDPNHKAKSKSENDVKKCNNIEKNAEINYKLEKTEDIKQINGKELDR